MPHKNSYSFTSELEDLFVEYFAKLIAEKQVSQSLYEIAKNQSIIRINSPFNFNISLQIKNCFGCNDSKILRASYYGSDQICEAC